MAIIIQFGLKKIKGLKQKEVFLQRDLLCSSGCTEFKWIKGGQVDSMLILRDNENDFFKSRTPTAGLAIEAAMDKLIN